MAKSLTNTLIDLKINESHPAIFASVSALESGYHIKQNKIADLLEENKQLKFSNSQMVSRKELTSISKKLNLDLRDDAQKYAAEIIALRGAILDHFTIAYMGETGLLPSQVKLVQYKDADGSIAFAFEKYSKLELAR